jgi:uncharacterized membrane protein
MNVDIKNMNLDKKNIHDYRMVGGFAIVDVVLTIVFIIILMIIGGKKSISVFLSLFVTMIITAISVHNTLGVPTKLNYYLGLSEDPSV